MNRVFVIGNLTRDPETKTTQDGKTVCTFTIAVNRRAKRDQNGQNEADFFRVSAWEKTGENCQKYLTKGKKVAVVGSVSVHAYTAQDGTARGSLEVRASDVEFLSNKNDEGGEAVAAAAASAPEAAPAPAPAGGFTETNPDDLPF